jgi:NAD(P)-dependent dehydrogenase (short-subunit alcohol dehydrogenase family)
MKSAVTSLTRTLALELAGDRIRVNAIAPDMIPTPGDAGLIEDSGAMSATEWAATPWPERGDPGDVAAAVVWLAGPMSRFVTGSTVHVDGGTFASSGWKRPLDGGPWVL